MTNKEFQERMTKIAEEALQQSSEVLGFVMTVKFKKVTPEMVDEYFVSANVDLSDTELVGVFEMNKYNLLEKQKKFQQAEEMKKMMDMILKNVEKKSEHVH